MESYRTDGVILVHTSWSDPPGVAILAWFNSPRHLPELWTRDGPWFVQTRRDLAETGHPAAFAEAYLCASFTRARHEPRWFSELTLGPLRDESSTLRNEPFVVTWADLSEQLHDF